MEQVPTWSLASLCSLKSQAGCRSRELQRGKTVAWEWCRELGGWEEGRWPSLGLAGREDGCCGHLLKELSLGSLLLAVVLGRLFFSPPLLCGSDVGERRHQGWGLRSAFVLGRLWDAQMC